MNAKPPVLLAIYDLDRTITSLPTWTPYLLFAARCLNPARLLFLPAVALVAARRAVGALHRDRLKEIMHRLLLGPAVPPELLAAVSAAFADWIVRHHLRPGAMARMAADRAEGRRIVIATAAHRFYAGAIAERLGVADVVATQARRDATGRILPGLDGPNCYGAAKQVMVADWFASTGLDREATHIRFYSDHASDQPTFDWVDEPVAVNPRARLRTLAGERGWEIADWGRQERSAT
jgi:HAD superfamily hydrolase (TIGR01490 family)